MKFLQALPILLIAYLDSAAGVKILLTNDDGWAVAQIRAEYDALKAAGHDVVLSGPADNRSGSGSSTETPRVVTNGCQFSTCPRNSPAIGFNATDDRLNYVNAYPVDAVRYGIQTRGPSFWGSGPDLVVSGANVGSNLGSVITGISGTVGAACEAAKQGYPSIAFSGSSGSQVSYTTLTSSPTSSSSKTARIYTDLVLKLTNVIVGTSKPYLPTGISLNVNFASTSSCTSASAYKFILTRISSSSSSTDVTTCGTNKLPAESSAIGRGCIVTVSVMNGTTKADVPAATQAVVLSKLSSILSCL
ncbi:survival protein sure-like phosphatase/nucleotidase [Coprinopsis sp. MPI-PUGE-AT-0042]|nr:survival protein sure-like phosphatase/nucleotidase [Coprinopsis sp. MPI-PUGE-AT-0042]